ncbi:interference hedgehog [Nilaparvata lugens]|uniref:interference hedgehog n=1 Tax=Nilaparvata lugens TaxID=108931 RepID=UPI00193D4714|nr:interference hedgehog [Nilaparvata lugens]
MAGGSACMGGRGLVGPRGRGVIIRTGGPFGWAVCLLLASVAVTPVCSYVGLWFVRSPEPIVAPPGDEVNFECSLNVPAERVRWRHAGRLLNTSAAASNVSAVRVSSSSHLMVKVTDENQTGDYQCIAWFGASALASTPAKLTLAELKPFLYQPLRHYTVTVGNTVAIDCPAPVSNPNHVGTHKLPVPSTRTLLLVNVTSRDAGVYTCMATNYITAQTVTSPLRTTLVVTQVTTPSPPRFLATPQSLYVSQIGQNVTMECSGVGTPPPRVSWRREGVPGGGKGGLPRDRHELEVGGAVLRLLNVQRSDEGIYYCDLSSGTMPTASHQITLQLQEAPIVREEPNSSVVEEGGVAELQCKVTGVPEPTLVWLLNGEGLHNDSHVKTEANGSKLIIDQVEKRHAGIYQCFASNPVGVTYGSAMLQVSPKQVTAQGDDDVDVDDNGDPISLIAASLPASNQGGQGGHNHGKKDHTRKQKGRRKDKKHKGNVVMIPPSKPNVTRLSDKSVMVRWSVPSNDGLQILFFKVQYKELGPHGRRGESTWMTSNEEIASHVRSYEVDGLDTDHTYRFRIAAVYSNNDNKLGPNSAKFHLHRGIPLNRTPLVAPNLTNLTAMSPNTIQIEWEYLNSVLAPVDGFYVYYRETSTADDYIKATVEGESTRAFNITHLRANTAYDVKLQAFTVGTASDFSEIFTCKTQKEPNATVVVEPDEKGFDGTGLRPHPAVHSNGQLYVVVGSVLAGLALLCTLVLLICICNKHRSSGAGGEDKSGGVGGAGGGGGGGGGLMIQQLEPVTLSLHNGSAGGGASNGFARSLATPPSAGSCARSLPTPPLGGSCARSLPTPPTGSCARNLTTPPAATGGRTPPVAPPPVPRMRTTSQQSLRHSNGYVVDTTKPPPVPPLPANRTTSLHHNHHPTLPINITSNPLAESAHKDKNVIEMSYLSSQNNNRSSGESLSNHEVDSEISDKLSWRNRDSRLGENYV